MLRVGYCGRGEREFLFCYRQLNQDRASAIVRMRTHVYPKRVLLELVPGRGGSGAGGVVAAESGGLLPGGLSARPGGGCGVERADGAGIEQPVEGGGATSQVDAGQRSLAQTHAGRSGAGVEAAGGAGGGGNEERAEECVEVGIVADDEQVLVAGVLAQKLLELGEGGVGSERGGGEDFGLVAHLCADERGGLHGALQGAGDDEVELELHGVEDMGELEAVALAVLVEGTLVVEDRVGALHAGAGVAQDIEVHRARDIVGQVRGSWFEVRGAGCSLPGGGAELASRRLIER